MIAQTQDGPVDEAAVAADVIDIIRPYAKPDPKALTPATRLDKIGVDSFDFVEIIFKIEEKFGVEIDYNVNSTFSTLVTIENLAKEVAALVAAKKVK